MLTRQERILAWSLAAASLALRALAFFHYRFDSDEQQHLHVTWGWTAGLVQYRDYFDNHAPLFHLLTAPLLMLFGERADILLWMRLPMLVTFAAVIACTYRIGRELYDERVALWAAVILSLFPPFFLKSLEFRIDNLWTALWMMALVLIVRQRRPFVAGLLLGAALAVSLKTTLLVATLAVTALIVRRRGWSAGRMLAGFAIVPAIVAAFFAIAGAWDALVYCNFTFNSGIAATRPQPWPLRAAAAILFPLLLWAARRFRTEHVWRDYCAVATGVFTLLLAGFWPLISPRDFLPVMPLLAIFVAAIASRAARPARVYAAIGIVSIAALFYYARAFRDETEWHITMMQQALRLTRPGEMIMDVKGETIYRRRPFYYVFETVARAQMMRGLIRDTVAADVIRTRTHVAQADGPMWPPQARAFLSENFLDMGRLRASGQWIAKDGSFAIAVPGEYLVVSERGAMGPAREYAAGRYRIHRKTNEPLAVMWAPAFRRGHSPFHLRDREF